MERPYIGGQAVIEGVMMRAPGCLSVAVRRPDGTLALREGPFRSRFARLSLWKLPGLRGVAMLVESLTLGFRALQFSAEQQMTEAEAAESRGGGGMALGLSTLLALGLFIALPQGLAAIVGRAFGHTFSPQEASFHFAIGGFKLLILLSYLGVISRLPEVKRLFQYHGAEHKTIYAYEADLPLTLENVRRQSTLHPRCGTTFLVVVVVVSILVGSIATPLLLPNAGGLVGQVQTLGLRIGLLPVIAAISYELQRLSARYCTTGPLRLLLWPGFLVQKITTREPADDQIEVAIAAMEAAQWRERVGDAAPVDDRPLIFESLAAFERALPTLRATVS